MPKSTKWEDLSDPERIEQLHNDLEETNLAIKNLTHDVGRLAARQTTTETALTQIAKALELLEGKVFRKK
jgi:hypothetical protein